MLAGDIGQLTAVVLVCVALSSAAYTGWRVYLWKRQQEERLAQLAQQIAHLAQLRTRLAGGTVLSASGAAPALSEFLDLRTVKHLLAAGVPLRPLLKALEVSVRNQRQSLQHTWTQLAGIRATTLVLTQLPVFGIVLGYLVGAHPLTFLTHGWGSVVLLLGVTCQCAGVWWIGRMVRAIQPPESHISTQLEVNAALLLAGLPLVHVETQLNALLPARQRELLHIARREGTPLATILADLAQDLQAETFTKCQQHIEETGVLLARPLGICFLPGFLLLGMLPPVVELGGAFMGIT